MAVYVDDMKAEFGRMIMCHMVADTHDELVEMADKLNLNRKWLQKPGTAGEHFDVSLGYRAKAVKLGAKEITWTECGEMCWNRRGEAGKLAYYGHR